MTVVDVVMWVFVAIFAVAASISLLDMIGIVTIRDADQRKWLFRSLIGAVVLAVASFGARQFGTRIPPVSGPSATTTPTSVVSTAPTPSPGSTPVQRPVVSPTPSPSSRPGPSPGPSVAPDAPACASSEAVLAWAAEKLGPRPDIATGFEQDYPACVATLSAADQVDDDAASSCRAALEVHKAKFISPFFAAKIDYDARLKREERALRQGGVSSDELPIYNHVLCENESYNFDGGKDLERLNAAEARINDDIRSCRSRGCK